MRDERYFREGARQKKLSSGGVIARDRRFVLGGRSNLDRFLLCSLGYEGMSAVRPHDVWEGKPLVSK